MSIEKIIEILNRRYKVKLSKEEPFDVLISTVLSHRTKDEISWPASERLLKAAGNLEKLSRLPEKKAKMLCLPHRQALPIRTEEFKLKAAWNV